MTVAKPKYTSEQIRSARELIERETDLGKLKGWIATGKRLNEKTIISAASLQLCRLPIRNVTDPLLAEALQGMRALEFKKSEKAGATRILARTRRKLEKDGIEKLISDIVLKTTYSENFAALVEFGMPDMTFEALALKYRARFAPEVIEAAYYRLCREGLKHLADKMRNA